MRVSKDKYSLPEVIAPTIYELAERCGVTVETIRSTMSHYKRGRLKRERYLCVVVEGDDE